MKVIVGYAIFVLIFVAITAVLYDLMGLKLIILNYIMILGFTGIVYLALWLINE